MYNKDLKKSLSITLILKLI